MLDIGDSEIFLDGVLRNLMTKDMIYCIISIWIIRLHLVAGFKYFLFSPLPGEMVQLDVRIFFKMGWINHQLVVCVCVCFDFVLRRHVWLQAILGRKHCPSLSREIGSIKIDWLWWNMSLPCRNVLEDKLYATICVQNSESFFRMSLTFQECTLQTEAHFENSKKRDDFSKGRGTEGSPNFK